MSADTAQRNGRFIKDFFICIFDFKRFTSYKTSARLKRNSSLHLNRAHSTPYPAGGLLASANDPLCYGTLPSGDLYSIRAAGGTACSETA
jgi:hypothetical protein